MITIFKRIKSDLKEMYDILQENPDHERYIKRDMLVAQQVVNDSLQKLKKHIRYTESTDQGRLFE